MAEKNPSTILEAQELLAKKEITAQELTQSHLKSIQDWENNTSAFLQIFSEEALAQAQTSDKKIQEGSGGVLEGIPIAIKDNICTQLGKTTAASKMLERFSALYNATVIQKLKAAGAVIIGKTNLDEFAMGSSTEFSAFGATKNPWDLSRVPGGSSGGSAVAVSYGGALGALGTDTGGSIRHPAGFCNVVGVKPTYGRVSRFGAIAYGSSLDQIGPFARTVKDAALLLQVMAGQDKYDATSSNLNVPNYVDWCGKEIKGLKIGVPKEFLNEDITLEVKEVIEQAISDLEELGAVIVPVSLPLTSAGIAVYYLLAKAEASSNLSRYDGLRYYGPDKDSKNLIEHYVQTRGQGFGPEVKRAILMGTYALSAGYYDAWYKQAGKVRTLIRQEYEEVFKEVDLIAAPVSPEVAFKFGSKTDDPLAMYMADALTVPLSVAGVPALSVPAGFTKEGLPAGQAGLPVGLQIAAPHFKEEIMFQAAHAYEQSHTWWKKMPALV